MVACQSAWALAYAEENSNPSPEDHRQPLAKNCIAHDESLRRLAFSLLLHSLLWITYLKSFPLLCTPLLLFPADRTAVTLPHCAWFSSHAICMLQPIEYTCVTIVVVERSTLWNPLITVALMLWVGRIRTVIAQSIIIRFAAIRLFDRTVQPLCTLE